MDTIPGIVENGLVRPLTPLGLQELTPVDIVLPPVVAPAASKGPENLYRLLDQRFKTGIPDLAERHNEHQP